MQLAIFSFLTILLLLPALFANTPPHATVTISPLMPTTSDVVKCYVTIVDAEQTQLYYSAKIFRNGNVLSNRMSSLTNGVNTEFITSGGNALNAGDKLQCEIIYNDGAGSMGVPSPLSTSTVTVSAVPMSLTLAMSSFCAGLTQMLPVAAMLMTILAGVIYASGQMMGAETRARTNVWTTAALTGALAAILITVVAPQLLTAINGAAVQC